MFKKYSFKHLLFLSMTSLFLVSIAIIIAVNYRVSVTEIVNLSAQQQRTNLLLIQESLNEQLRSIENNAVVMARQSNLRNVISGGTSYYQANLLTLDLSNTVYTNGSVHSIEIFMNEPPTNNIQNPVRYGELEQALETTWMNVFDEYAAAWVGIRSIEMIYGEDRVISHARVIKNARGQTEGILVVNLDPLIVENWLRKFDLASTLYLVNNTGHVLASTNVAGIGENFYRPDILTDSAEQTHSHTIDDELIVTSALLPYQWTLIGVTPYQALTQSSVLVAQRLISLGVITISVALIIALLLSKQLTKPIKELTCLMNHYQLNRSQQQIPDDYKNEFGQLFSGYKNLINRNEQLHHSYIKKYKQHKQAELKALQANINPHFLYNTLDQINWRAIEHGDDDMSRIIELLGEMLRIGLSNGESILTIENEVDYLEKYLKLQLIRMKGNFMYDLTVAASVKQALIPKLTLQPFVENAIVHGLAGIAHGKLELSVTQVDKRIIISIKDNGIGADSFKKKQGDSKSGGYGIQNVRERLTHYFNYQAKLTLSNHQQGGVEVQINIPFITDQHELG
ncbi:two-component system, sensor histidine kinase YesM [Amphibacillus marinus]|uniref:Two-component system, sensor histidine kinase YesM n=1 Tax=Amphibacillus marinus TaxID=872970 RepID=A0A1H8H661_9BACI|nr:sensor histidine kinase [Amphibacillus marinus]SEN51743.1 two-component system, sensor histidine kinase YesM [Amphibacillus marinus]